MPTEQIGALLRRSRKALGITQRELAQRAGVSVRLWAEVERGERPNVSLESALRMLSLVGVSVRLDGPLGAFRISADPAVAAESRAARAAVRRATWEGRQIRLDQEGAEDSLVMEAAVGIDAVSRVSEQAYEVSQSRRRWDAG